MAGERPRFLRKKLGGEKKEICSAQTAERRRRFSLFGKKYSSPNVLTEQIFSDLLSQDGLPEAMKYGYGRTEKEQRQQQRWYQVRRVANEIIWQPSRAVLGVSERLSVNHPRASGEYRGIRLGLHDVNPLPKGKFGKFFDTQTQWIRDVWNSPQFQYPKVALQIFSLFPLLAGVPLKWAKLPLHIPSIAINIPLVHKIWRLNPADSVPIFNPSLNALSAAAVFGIPNIYRSANEHRYGRAIFYAGLHAMDIILPIVITNSFFWDFFARSHDTARVQGRLKMLHEMLTNTTIPLDRRKQYQEYIGHTVRKFAEKFGMNPEEYLSSFAQQQQVLFEEKEAAILHYEGKKQELEKVIAKKKNVGGVKKLWIRFTDEAFARHDIEQARRDAIQIAMRMQELPLVRQVLADAGFDTSSNTLTK